MKTRIVKIGNSQGIRIPKPFLEQTGLSTDVEIEITDDRLVIRAADRPRANWAGQFGTMARLGDDTILSGDSLLLLRWGEEDWEW